jgi:hypothetical protein
MPDQSRKRFRYADRAERDHFLDDSAYYNRRRWDYFIRHLQQREPLPLNTPDTVSVK